MHHERGFTLVETIVAAAITLAVLASVFAMAHPARGAFDTGLEAADVQQRLRVAVDTFARDLATAGAGAQTGSRLGPMNRFVAAVLPYRAGQSGDPPGTVRADVVTILSIPSTAAQATVATDFTSSDLTLQAEPASGCPPGANLCGFAPGMSVLVFDDVGNVDAFTVGAVLDASAQLTLAGRPDGAGNTISKRGASVVEGRLRTYFLKPGATSRTFQLMRSDGPGGPDVPVVDHVVGLTFDYDGDPRAPSLLASGETTYGPAPPPPGTQPTAYPIGENCVFRIDEATGLPLPRLPALTAGAALTTLTASELGDGPWCPDEASANRWDADLLRVRRIGVTVRIEAAPAALRGPAGLLFSNGGTSRDPNRWVPDRQIRFQVSPRNLAVEP